MKNLFIHVFNTIFYLTLSTFCYFSDPHGGTKTKDQFPFKNYYLLSTKIPKSNYNTLSREKRDIDTTKCINLKLPNTSHEICFSIYDSPNNALINNYTTFIICNNKSENHYNFNQLNIKLTKGYVRNKPYTSAFSGYTDDNKLYGRMELDSKVFYIEPLDKFPFFNATHIRNAVMYEVSANKSNITVQYSILKGLRRQKRQIQEPGLED